MSSYLTHFYFITTYTIYEYKHLVCFMCRKLEDQLNRLKINNAFNPIPLFKEIHSIFGCNSNWIELLQIKYTIMRVGL